VKCAPHTSAVDAVPQPGRMALYQFSSEGSAGAAEERTGPAWCAPGSVSQDEDALAVFALRVESLSSQELGRGRISIRGWPKRCRKNRRN